MRRRFLIAGAGMLACVVVAGFAASARGSSSALTRRPFGLVPSTLPAGAIPVPKGAKTLRVQVSNFTATGIDNPPSGTSQGDEQIGAGQLFKKRAPAGELEIQETLTSLTPGRITLTAVALLARGQITVSAVLHPANTPLVRAAILGGTGAYAKIRGVMYATSTNSTTTLTFVYTTS